MGYGFWARRFVLVWLGAFVVIGAAHLVRGRPLAHAITEAGIWGLITAAVFVAARAWQASRSQHCAVCRDTPEMRDAVARRVVD